MALEQELGVNGCELNSLIVMDLFRGHGGGELLTEAMLADLRLRNVAFVMLRRMDRSGKDGLRRFYERIGFHDVGDVLPVHVAAKINAESPKEACMIGIVSDLYTQALPAICDC